MSATAEVVRAFWHGQPLNPYQLAGLRSFVVRGHAVEVFSYQKLEAPSWLSIRDANEIFPTQDVLRYQDGPGRGSSSLHSNLFRYAMLHKLGGWWIDMDMVLLQPELPAEEFFFAREDDTVIAVGAVKFPAGHPLLEQAVTYFEPGKKDYQWGQTGPRLFSELVGKFDLRKWERSPESTYPLHWSRTLALFDPDQRKEVETISSESIFLHLSNEIWRRCGVPTTLAPPKGSWLEGFLEQYGMLGNFTQAMSIENVRRWFDNWAGGQDVLRESEARVTMAHERLAELEKNASAWVREAEDRVTKSHVEIIREIERNASQQLKESEHRVARAHDRIAELEARDGRTVKELEALLAQADRRVSDIYESTSWRITKPLRYVSMMANQFKSGR